MTEELKKTVDELATAWEQFKKVNDTRLNEMEKKGSSDPLLAAQLERLNAAMDEQKQRTEEIAKAASRAALGDTKADETKDAAEYKAAFNSYVRKGVEEKALSVNSEPDGGYLVPKQMSDIISTVVYESSPMRQLATVVPLSSDSLDLIRDAGEFGAGWAGEEATRSATTNAQLGLLNIPAYEMYAKPQATQKLLDDAGINVEAWIAQKIAERFARLEATAFVSGNGVEQPTGILSYANGTSGKTVEQVNSGTSGSVTADGLISLFYKLKSDYVRNASFLMHRTTVGAVRTLKDTTNQYIWQPGLAAGQPDMLLGAPVFMASDMPTAAANSLSVALGDFKRAYVIADRIGIRTLRDPFSSKPMVEFYTTKRVGGSVVNFEAVKLLKLA